MYISIKLPPAFGSFNRLRKENYPFNNLFTTYLAAVSRLGLELHMDVDELVGYIEDRIFEGQRVPDVPEGTEPVNIRYKTEDPDVIKYIGGSSLTNRMAVMYIARMTMRLSAAYGTSLFRLTKLIADLDPSAEIVRTPKKPKEQPAPKPAPKPVSKPKEEPKKEQEPLPMPRISSKAPVQQEVLPEQQPVSSSVLKSAEEAKKALSELAELTAQAEETDDGAGSDVVETNPYLSQFGGL